MAAVDVRTAPPPPAEAAPAERAPSGRLLLLAALAIAGLSVGVAILAARPAAPAASPPPLRRPYELVELGGFKKEIVVDASSLVHETFEVKVGILLNPEYGDLAVVRPLVEKRRDLLRHIVGAEIINPKSDADLRKPTVLENLGLEIRARLNAELGPSPAGQELVHKVIFPDIRLPARR